MPLIDDLGLTDRVTTPTCAGLRRCRWPWPHASPRWLTANGDTLETYYYGYKSMLIGRYNTQIFAFDF